MALSTTATATALRPMLAVLAATAPAPAHHSNPLIHMLLSFGIVGVFFVSIVDSSFVPLPIPGITDIMIVVLAAQHANLILLVGTATVGSFLGGLFSYKVGHAGGIKFLEKHVPAHLYSRVSGWMQAHAILAVALPAILPPPMPLSPFVLAAGAMDMPRNKFLVTFTSSRLVRHAGFAALGVYFGPQVLRTWNRFSRTHGTEILIVIWSVILVSLGVAGWRLYKTSRDMRNFPSGNKPTPARA